MKTTKRPLPPVLNDQESNALRAAARNARDRCALSLTIMNFLSVTNLLSFILIIQVRIYAHNIMKFCSVRITYVDKNICFRTFNLSL